MPQKILTLTDFDTGKPTFVRRDAIILAETLPAEVWDDGDCEPEELGERTKLVVEGGEVTCVRESAPFIILGREHVE